MAMTKGEKEYRGVLERRIQHLEEGMECCRWGHQWRFERGRVERDDTFLRWLFHMDDKIVSCSVTRKCRRCGCEYTKTISGRGKGMKELAKFID